MKRKKGFFRQFLKERKMVGSITPSSAYLSKKMISKVNFEKAKCIIELGPGDGCITKEIIKKMGPDTHLFLFEMNKDFVDQYLQYNDKRIHVINDSAEFMRKYLNEFGLDHADYIVSSLPLTNFPEELKIKIIDEAVDLLKPGGVYTQYQYVTTAAKLLKQKFSKVNIRFAPYNIPPAFVYTCYN